MQTIPPPDPSWDNPGALPAPGDQAAAPRRRLLRRIVAIVMILLGVGALVAALVTVWGLRRLDDLSTVDVAGVDPSNDGSADNWLLVGTDSRDGIDGDAPDALAFLGEPVEGVRTDTMMIVRVDREAGTVDLLSVPRDLWVPIAGRGSEGRINGSFNGESGRERLVATMRAALGVEINHYVEVDFVGFRQIVDVLEGVPVWFDHPARDLQSGLHIVETGCHVLDGGQALALARARTLEEMIDDQWRLEPTGDLGRTARQRLLLARVVAAVGDRSLLRKIGLIDDMLDVMKENLLIEDGASRGDLLGLGRMMASIDRQQIVGHSLPVEDFRTSGGAQVLRLSDAAAQPVLDLFRSGAPIVPVAIDPSADQSAADPPLAEVQDSGSEQPEGDLSDGYGAFGFTAATSAAGTRCQ